MFIFGHSHTNVQIKFNGVGHRVQLCFPAIKKFGLVIIINTRF